MEKKSGADKDRAETTYYSLSAVNRYSLTRLVSIAITSLALPVDTGLLQSFGSA